MKGRGETGRGEKTVRKTLTLRLSGAEWGKLEAAVERERAKRPGGRVSVAEVVRGMILGGGG